VSIDLQIVASAAGLSGNVLANTIAVLASAVPGIDNVNNETATSGGADPETDGAFRVRFANFFAARSRATVDAIAYAISLVGPDLKYVIQENVDAAGNIRLGNMLIVIDNGSGVLAQTLVDSLSFAIQVVRPIGTTFSIQPPQIIQVRVTLTVLLRSESPVSTIQAKLQLAIQNYISSLGIGSTLSVTRISQLVYRTEPRTVNVSNVTLNGQGMDLVAPSTTSFLPQSVSFT